MVEYFRSQFVARELSSFVNGVLGFYLRELASFLRLLVEVNPVSGVTSFVQGLNFEQIPGFFGLGHLASVNFQAMQRLHTIVWALVSSFDLRGFLE